MNLAIDIDDVVAEFIPYLLATLDWPDVDMKSPNLHNWFTKYSYNEELEYKARVTQIVESIESYENLEPVAGAKDALWTLANKHNITYITSRPIETFEVTKRWLGNRNFPNWENVIVCGRLTPKSVYMKKFNLEYLLDDSPRHFESLGDKIQYGIWDKPWNRDILGNRFFSWNHFLLWMGSKHGL